MTLPPSDHIIWKLIRMAVVGVIMVVMLKFNYANGWAPQDYITLIATLMALGGYDALKQMTAPH
jgi:hypothetical protein